MFFSKTRPLLPALEEQRLLAGLDQCGKAPKRSESGGAWLVVEEDDQAKVGGHQGVLVLAEHGIGRIGCLMPPARTCSAMWLSSSCSALAPAMLFCSCRD